MPYSVDVEWYRQQGYTEAEARANAAGAQRAQDAWNWGVAATVLSGGLFAGILPGIQSNIIGALGDPNSRKAQEDMKRANKNAHDAGQGYVYNEHDINALDNRVTKQSRVNPWLFGGMWISDSAYVNKKTAKGERYGGAVMLNMFNPLSANYAQYA